jgi:hypothetical protein
MHNEIVRIRGLTHTRSLAKGVLLQDPVELDTRLFESFQSVLRTACMYESLRAGHS